MRLNLSFIASIPVKLYCCSLSEVWWRPWQVEVIVDLVMNFVRDLDWCVFSIKSGIELILIEWLRNILCLLDWIAILIFIILASHMLLRILLLHLIPSLLKVRKLALQLHNMNLKNLQSCLHSIPLLSWHCGPPLP